MAQKDVILKYLSHISPDQITEFIGSKEKGLRYLSEEIKDLRMTDLHADLVLETESDKILHVEFQQDIRRDTLNRFYVYNALLTRQFDRPVDTYVIYLGGSKIGGQVIKSGSVLFKPSITKVHEMDSGTAIEKIKAGSRNYIAMALIPLMTGIDDKKLIELVDLEAKMDVERELKDDILTSTLVMARTVYDEDLVNSLKVRLIKMFDVDIFEKERKEAIEQGLQKGLQKGLQQGLKQGLKQGIEQGELEKLREVVSKLLMNKFKEKFKRELRKKVRDSDKETLEYIADHIFEITLEEVAKIV